MNLAFILCIVIWITAVVYVRMRDKIPFFAREKFEKLIMVVLLILLIINTSFLLYGIKIKSEEINDCIRFYRYYPDSPYETEFYFIKEKCFEYYNEEQIESFKTSGRNWYLMNQENKYENPFINFTK